MTEGPDEPDNSALSPDSSFQSLNDQLSRGSLKSTSRILILILLAMNKRSTATELRTLTGLGKGSLQNHLEKLEAVGYVKTKNVKSFGGWRQTVEITQEGLEGCRELLRTLRSLKIQM